MKFYLFVFWIIMVSSRGFATRDSHRESPCCLALRPGHCKSACEKIPASKYVSNLTKKNYIIEELESACSNEKQGFWTCINRHLRGDLWSGSSCCHRGHGWLCQMACVNATHSTHEKELQRLCRKSDEVELYKCLEQKAKSDHCCRKAKENRDCTAACQDAINTDTMGVSEATKLKVETNCARSPEVLDCLSKRLGFEQRDTTAKPVRGIPSSLSQDRLSCCEDSSTTLCREKCKSILRLDSDEHEREIMNELETVCGEPILTDKFWQCIILKSSSNKTRAEGKRKQQTRSPSLQQGTLTQDTKMRMFEEPITLMRMPEAFTEIHVSEEYNYYDAFSSREIKGVGNGSKKKTDSSLRQKKVANDLLKLQCCSRATTEDCRQLCQEVYLEDYSRIMEFEKKCLHTRSSSELEGCLLEVDEPCQPGCDGLSFCSIFNRRPAETFRSCKPSADNAAQIDYASWVSGKSVITFLEHRLPVNVTRCHPEIWQAFSCYHHIKPCGKKGTTGVPKICMKDCYDLLYECLEDTDSADMANYMCSIFASSSNDCISLKEYLSSEGTKSGGSTQVTVPCTASNQCAGGNQICTVESHPLEGRTYTCRPGCRLGESSIHMVQNGAWVTTPCGEDGCIEICRCGEKGNFERCQRLGSPKMKSCIVGNREIEHGTQFTYDCNVCGCSAGELTCTKRKCVGGLRRSQGSLPCKCPETHDPVCGSNGKTYPNQCVARCNMQSEVKHGSCKIVDLGGHGCQSGQVEIPFSSTCLAHRKWQDAFHCKQSICVSTSQGSCEHGHLGSVCDIYHRTHLTVCDLVRAQVPFAYWGACQLNCSLHEVCGIDGMEYTSECEAKARHMPVDYHGRCRHVGDTCESVQCPTVPRECTAVTPPGACCPKCLNYIRVVLSNKQLYKVVMTTESHNLATVSYLLSVLRAFMSVNECRVGGYLHYEGDVILYTYSDTNTFEVCATELVRIYTALLTKSPRVQVDPVLGAIVAVDASGTSSGSFSSANLHRQHFVFIILYILVFYCY